ncbi:MAG: FecR family protein, partial [Treponema sp.]|nr:FecR family protein [Treponema sp.]
MKKTMLVLFMMFVALSVFAQSGVIRELSGTVELKLAGATNFVPASTGAEVSRDTVISTGFKSTALIEVGSTVIAVRPLTRLTLTEIQASQGSETLNVNLSAGRVRVDVNPPAGTKASMSVTGPSATASVRGTSLLFDGRNVATLKGMVDLASSLGGIPVQVPAGFVNGMGWDGKPLNSVYSYTVASSGAASDITGSTDGLVLGNVESSGGDGDGFVQVVVGSDPSSGSA